MTETIGYPNVLETLYIIVGGTWTQYDSIVVGRPDGKYRSRFVLRGPEGTPEPPFKVFHE